MKSVVAVSLADLHAEMGEKRLGRLLAGFSCAGLNDEVESNFFEEFKMPSDGDKEGRLGQLFLFLK